MASLIDAGGRRMLAEAPRAEVDAYIAAHAADRDKDDRRLGAQRLVTAGPHVELSPLFAKSPFGDK